LYAARGGCMGLQNTSHTTAVQRLLGLLVLIVPTSKLCRYQKCLAYITRC